MEQFCKRCQLFGEDSASILANIQTYINSLEDHVKVTHEIYNDRLKHCENCQSLINGLCKHCGCFVLVRALKKNQHCPSPTNKNW